MSLNPAYVENAVTLKATQEIKSVMMCHDMFLEYTLLFSITKICLQQSGNKEAIVSSSHAHVVHSQEDLHHIFLFNFTPL
jgi:hypothetical protein